MDANQYSCLNCTSRFDSLLSELSNDELKILDRNKNVVFYKSGEKICKEGTKPSGLICLKEGKVKMIRNSSNGVEHIMGLKKTSDFIDLRALFTGNTCLSSSIAIEDCSVCIINKSDFKKVLLSNKNLSYKIIEHFAHTLITNDSRYLCLTQKRMKARIAESLLLIKNMYGINSDTGALNVPLKRSDLAALSNMTTANAIRVLSGLKKDKIVAVSHRKVSIKNLRALKFISTID